MAAATMYVTAAGAGTKAGNDWDNAMGSAEFVTDAQSNAEAGDIYYLLSGTYVESGSFNSGRDGAVGSPIRIVGVSATDLTIATGDDRPFFNLLTTNFFSTDNYWSIENIRVTSANGTHTARTDSYSQFVNCKSNNTSTGSAFLLQNYGQAIGCEAVSTGGIGINAAQGIELVYGCYVHDSATGINTGAGGGTNTVLNNVVDTCTTGIDVNTYCGAVNNNTIYNCTTGIDVATGLATTSFYGNAIDSCTTGVGAAAGVSSACLLDYNNYSNSGSDDVVNVTKGANATANQPVFTDAPNGDFSQTGLNNNGFPAEFPAGLTTSYPAQGAVVSKVTAGGGGSYGFVG